MFALNHWISHQCGAVKVDLVHINGGYLAVVVAGVIKHALFYVIACRIDGRFAMPVVQYAAAARLIDRAHYMEVLAYALFAAIAHRRIERGKRRPHKPRLRG